MITRRVWIALSIAVIIVIYIALVGLGVVAVVSMLTDRRVPMTFGLAVPMVLLGVVVVGALISPLFFWLWHRKLKGRAEPVPQDGWAVLFLPASRWSRGVMLPGSLALRSDGFHTKAQGEVAKSTPWSHVSGVGVGFRGELLARYPVLEFSLGGGSLAARVFTTKGVATSAEVEEIAAQMIARGALGPE